MAPHMGWIQQSGNHTCLPMNQFPAYLLGTPLGMTSCWNTDEHQPLLCPLVSWKCEPAGCPNMNM